MKLGDIVLVVGHLDEKVRSKEKREGTIVFMYGDDVEVLFEDGTIWRGLKREVIKYE